MFGERKQTKSPHLEHQLFVFFLCKMLCKSMLLSVVANNIHTTYIWPTKIPFPSDVLAFEGESRIQIRMDPHHFREPDPDPHQSKKLDPDPHRIQKHDPDPHQSENPLLWRLTV